MEKILYLIDDSRFMLKILEEKIRTINSEIKIIAINNPEILIENGIHPNTAGIIVDYNMPVINGVDLILKINEMKKFGITFLLLSASSKISNSEILPEKVQIAQKPISDKNLEIFINLL